MENKVKKVMHEFKHGELHSGSKEGPVVSNRKQALAIGLSEARHAKSKALKHSKKRSKKEIYNNMLRIGKEASDYFQRPLN